MALTINECNGKSQRKEVYGCECPNKGVHILVKYKPNESLLYADDAVRSKIVRKIGTAHNSDCSRWPYCVRAQVEK